MFGAEEVEEPERVLPALLVRAERPQHNHGDQEPPEDQGRGGTHTHDEADWPNVAK
ncbi:hypothetical protein [Phytohabitans aurantiacus]|uniref:Uncharacterized protein n=1 Tax=Phytohabitans aurantiacus TaxID=3016789 RepID=A0ABQ5RAL2_9ACTN|nr:hypothetical protein [Phytohabitans aurantiacus]GLI03799.1 hypothetical protein Pa4123_90790 [Phytohabitans aurantiacus]